MYVPQSSVFVGVLLHRLCDLQAMLVDEVILVACHVAQWFVWWRLQSWIVVVQLFLSHIDVRRPGS